jgi:hypothetical protein
MQAAIAGIIQRAEWIRQATPIIGENLAIAQHRDTHRYAIRRSSAYSPRLQRFQPQDFVYVSRPGMARLGALI